jgi:ribosome maturation factor RimP
MTEALFGALSPLLAAHDLELVDLEVQPGLIRVTVDRPGGIDLEALSLANHTISAALDQLDPLPGRYTLEVSSPGVERRLRTPEHFARALGEVVTVRTLPGHEPRRLQGCLESCDEQGFVLTGDDVPGGTQHVPFASVERARTVFEWGPAPRPGGKKGQSAKGTSARKEKVSTS